MSAQFGHNRSPPAPPRSQPFVMAYAVIGLQAVLKLPPDEWQRLLAEVGLKLEQLADPESALPMEAGFAAFEAAAALVRNPRLCIDYATQFSVGGTGPLGFALVNAKNVREMLRTVSRFVPMVSSMSMIRYDEDDVAGSILWQYPGALSALSGQFVMWGTALTIERIIPSMPPGWKPHAVEFDIDQPPNASIYGDYFGPGLRFGQPINRLAVQAALLERAPASANQRLFEMMTRLAEIERKRRGIYGSQFEADARAAIIQLLRRGDTSVGDLADALHMPLSELRKTFNEHRLDYRALVDDVRKEEARTYLVASDISLTDIAFALGYADSSNFIRACKKWFGKAPRDVRAQALP